MQLHLSAPAKINLGLEVIRRRDDGFHDINTIFAAIDLRDELLLRPRADGRIVCRVTGNDALEDDDRNLCVRAARVLRDAAGGSEELGLEIELTKRIPIGAGLGGGSSDAAAVLMGARRLWSVPVDDRELHRLALSLGSDVPFFLHGGVAEAESRGELLRPLELHLPWSLLLVNPGIHVPTPWAYRAVGRVDERSQSDLRSILQRGLSEPDILRSEMVNDFEEAVFAEHPRLQQIKDELYRSGALYAAMSGSGSTMLGLFANADTADDAARLFGGEWRVVTRFLPAGSPAEASYRDSSFASS
jgi:4-diphosphocytidyl-2-C-methyl-D-erythritol kinase